MDINFDEIQNTKFTDPILKEVESVLFYLVQSYASLIKNPDNTHDKIQEFDKELGDFLERYHQLYNITSNLTELELQKIAVEFRNEITLSKNSISLLNTALTDKVNVDYKNIIDGYKNTIDGIISDLQSKVENNFFKGDKGEPFIFSDFTQEQIELLKIKGDKGDPFTYADFTQEQLDLLLNIHEKNEKTTLVDVDEFAVASSMDAFSLKKISWANIKTLLFSIFLKKIVSPITGALTKINSDGSLGSSNIIEKATKNILIGTDVDNGVDLLQINGNLSYKKHNGRRIGQVLFNGTITDSSSHILVPSSVGGLPNTSAILEICNPNSGLTYIPIYSFGGTGVKYIWNVLNPLTGSFVNNISVQNLSFSVTERGLYPNTYSIVIDGGNASVSIQATTFNSFYSACITTI